MKTFSQFLNDIDKLFENTSDKLSSIIYQIIGKVAVIHGIIDGRRNLRETMRQRILIWPNQF